MELWTEKYRPKSIDEYVFKNEVQRKQIESWINEQEIPGHLLLSGVQGTGKTSLAKMLFKEFDIKKGDILEINASEQRGIDTMRDKIIGFCSTWSLSGGMKYVLLDEADMLTPQAQPVLRNVMEKYHQTVRFIITCNYPQRILPAIHSRTQGFHFDALDKTEYTVRVGEILASENIDFEIDMLQAYVEQTYPDMRKCINLLQQHSEGGTLTSTDSDVVVQDYLLEMVALIQKGRINDARTAVCNSARVEEYEDIYRFMYENLELWGDSKEAQDAAILHIAKYLSKNTMVADKEINLAACFVELSGIS